MSMSRNGDKNKCNYIDTTAAANDSNGKLSAGSVHSSGITATVVTPSLAVAIVFKPTGFSSICSAAFSMTSAAMPVFLTISADTSVSFVSSVFFVQSETATIVSSTTCPFSFALSNPLPLATIRSANCSILFVSTDDNKTGGRGNCSVAIGGTAADAVAFAARRSFIGHVFDLDFLLLDDGFLLGGATEETAKLSSVFVFSVVNAFIWPCSSARVFFISRQFLDIMSNLSADFGGGSISVGSGGSSGNGGRSMLLVFSTSNRDVRSACEMDGTQY